MKYNKIKGSALIWALLILSVLAIVIITSVTVSMAYAAAAAKEQYRVQNYFTARSTAFTVEKLLNDGQTYSSSNQNTLEKMFADAGGADVDVKFADIGSDFYFGGTKASFSDNGTDFTLSVSTYMENIGTQNLTAEFKKSNVASNSHNYTGITEELNSAANIGLNINSFLYTGNSTSSVGTIAPPANVRLPANLCTEKYAISISNVNLQKPTIAVSFPPYNNTLKNNKPFSYKNHSYFNKNYDKTNIPINIKHDDAGGNNYFFYIHPTGTMSTAMTFTTDASDKTDNIYNCYIYAEPAKNNDSINLTIYPPDNGRINLFVYGSGHTNVTIIGSLFNGIVYCEKLIIPQDISMNYAEPDSTVFGISDLNVSGGSDNYKWQFVKFTEAE